MQKHETSIEGAYLIEPQVHGDDRGFFFESFNVDKFAALGLDIVIRQANHSKSAQGVLRGLHFQKAPKPMGKLVRCSAGTIWDVAVDLRKNSPTFMKWHGVELSDENKKMFYVPEGCAHGFYSMTDSEMLYLCTNTYDDDLDANVQWNDSAFGIDWKTGSDPALSERDSKAPSFEELNYTY
jgi:dTDP-4-dehydrorhamnose 3,5-epimerase